MFSSLWHWLRGLVERFLDLLRPHRPAVALQIVLSAPRLRPNLPVLSGEYTMDPFVLRNTEEVTLTFTGATDALGQPAKIDGALSWATSSPEKLELLVAEDGLSAVARTTGLLTTGDETVQVSVAADADLGAGIETITAIQSFRVQPSQAVSLGLAVGDPRLRDNLPGG